MKLMSAIEYSPPVRQEQIISKIEGPEGHVSSISLLLSDAHGKLFALHVATQANYLASSTEFDDNQENPEFPEPVFVVPAMTIDEPLLEDIMNGTKPEVLGMYLVPQDN